MAYFYFDFNDAEKQSSEKAIRSLLFQFAQQTPDGLHSVEHMYEKCGSGRQQPLDDTVCTLLHDVMDRTEFKYIILDALDECVDREDLSKFICDLADPKVRGLRVLATSRRERDIEEQLELIANHNINIQSAVVEYVLPQIMCLANCTSLSK